MATRNVPLTVAGTTRYTATVALDTSDLIASATSQVILLRTLRAVHPKGSLVPANARIHDAVLVRGVDFSGGGATSATVDAGDSVDPNELLAAVDVFTGAKATADMTVANGVYTLGTFEATLYTGQLTFTSDVDVDTLTAGACEIRIVYESFDTAFLSI